MNDYNKNNGTIVSRECSENGPMVEYDANGNFLAVSDDVHGSYSIVKTEGNPGPTANAESTNNSQIINKNVNMNVASQTPDKNAGKLTSFRGVEPMEDNFIEVAIDKQVTAHKTADGNGDRGFDQDGSDSAVRSNSRCGKVIFLLLTVVLLIVSMGGFAYFFFQWLRNQAEIERLSSSEEKLLTISDQCEELQASIEELHDHNQNLTLQLNLTNLEGSARYNICEDEKTNLENLVANLSQQADELSSGVDHYAALNDQLQAHVEDLDEQNQILNSSNIWYAELNNQLNESAIELDAQVGALTEQNEIYAALNEDLNVTAKDLSEQVDRLEVNIDNLEEQNEHLDLLVSDLSLQAAKLAELNDNINVSIAILEVEVDNLSNEIDRMEALNDNLENMVSFVNETANNIDESVDAISDFLSEQITVYRSLMLETIQNTFSQRIANWDCAYRDMFRLEDFANDGRLPIGAGSYPAAIEYIEDRVLSELCLSRNDFELYLDNQYVKKGLQPPVSATGDNFVRSIQQYTTFAMDYYFPDETNGESLTQGDWAEASYECENLPNEKRFSLMS